MPNIVYSVSERVELVRQYEQGISYQRIAKQFAMTHPGRPIPATATIRHMVRKFLRTGNLDAKSFKPAYPSRQLSQEIKFDVCAKAKEDPSKPASKIAKELKISKTSVQKILNAMKLKQCQSKEDTDNDKYPKIFSRNMMQHLKTDKSCLRRICFSNGSTILYVSKSDNQNVLICSWRIQHRLTSQSGIEYQKLHVWTGVVADKPIGPFFIEGILNGESYLKLLREKIVPALNAVDGEGPVIWYQQDGVPPYYTADVFAYLNQEFTGRWIGRNCHIQQLPDSLEISLLDNALLGRLKNILYSGEKIKDLSVLRTKVSGIIGSMDPQAVCNTIRAHYDRGAKEEDDVQR